MGIEILQNHVPLRFTVGANGPVVQWCEVGDIRFSRPFWDHDIEAHLGRPFNLFFQPRTSIEVLAAFAGASHAPEPSGFIFHMSRCGSTLITQMLGALADNIALSEPSVVDSILRIRHRFPAIPEETQIDWLRWMVAAIGYPRRPEERRLFIKFDCWHAMFLPVLRRAFPRVPFAFIYRDPVEVMVSQISRLGAQMMPHFVHSEIYGIAQAEAFQLSHEQYCARVLATICRSALEYHRADPMLLINYRQLPGVVWKELSAHFQIAFDDEEIERMQRNSRANAKQPELEFAADSDEKRRVATPEIRHEAEQWLAPLYSELEAERTGRSGAAA